MTMQPMAVWGLEVPAGDVMMPAISDIPSAFQITMAAIDPSAEPEGEEGAPQRATLKIIRQPLDPEAFEDSDSEDDEDDEDFDADEMERMLAEDDSDEDESEDEDVNGEGPSDPKKSKKARKEAANAEIKKLLEQDQMDVDEAKTNGINGVSKKAKGKMPASDEEESDEEEEDDDDDFEGEVEEFVICTLDPQKVRNVSFVLLDLR